MTKVIQAKVNKNTSVIKDLDSVAGYSSSITSVKKKPEKGLSRFTRQLIYYLMPIISIVIFFIIIFVGSIPSIKSIFSKIDQIKAEKETIENLDKVIAEYEMLQKKHAQTEQNLAVIDKIVPTGKSEVVKFVSSIEEIALENNLKSTKYKSGEQITLLQKEIDKKNKESGNYLISIPSESEYSASFDEIRAFLNSLYKKSDFIIISSLDMSGPEFRILEKKELNRTGKKIDGQDKFNNLWVIKVTFEKYQFSEGFKSVNQSNSILQVDETTLNFILSKNKSLN